MAFLSKIGSAIKRAAPEMIRGAIVAAANPTRGAVGTAGDIFGSIGAVEDDRMARMERQRQREMQALEMRRKAEDDAREAALNEARIAELNQRAEYQKRRGMQQAAKTVPPSKLQMYKEAFDHYKSQGFADEDAHVEARSIALGTPSPELYNKRTASTESAQRNRELDTWRKDPRLQEQYPKFEDYYRSVGIGAAMADTAGQVTTAKKRAEIPFLIRRPIPGDDQYYDQKITLNPEGTGAQVSYPATGIKTRQPAPQKETASDKRLTREEAIDRVVNRVLKEEGSGTRNPVWALRNVQNSYKNDPEVQQYLNDVITKLQRMSQGEVTAGKAEKFVEVNEKAKANRAKKPAAAVEVWTRDANGNLVRAK